MLRIGCIVLTLWAALNLVPSVWIVVSTTFLDANSPAIHQILSDQEVMDLTPKERTSINSVAVYANGLNIAFCVTALFVIWSGLIRRNAWAFWCCVLGFGAAVAAGALGDFVLGNRHPEITAISALILVVGCVFSAVGAFAKNQTVGRSEESPKDFV